MYGLNFSGFVSLRAALVVLLLVFATVAAGEVQAGMLVVQGKRSHYVASQEEGIVYAVYGDGEWVRFADGMGYISGLAACNDSSLYVMSRTQKRLFHVGPDGRVLTVRKVDEVPEAIFVDRDGELKFVQHNRVEPGLR